MVGDIQKMMEENVRELADKVDFSFEVGADKDFKGAFTKISKR